MGDSSVVMGASGYGDGYGSGYGSGYGDGSGYGSGYGDGSGSGYGSGDGDGSGLEGTDGMLLDWIRATDIPATFALAQDNLEFKRLLIERIGAQRFFSELQARIVHTDMDGCGNPRRLLRIPVSGFAREHVLAVQVVDPSTKREYVLGVPGNMKTCQEAVAWTFGIKPEEYAPLIEA